MTTMTSSTSTSLTVGEILQHLFYVWPISFSILSLRIINVATNGRIPFFLKLNLFLLCICHIFIIYLSVGMWPWIISVSLLWKYYSEYTCRCFLDPDFTSFEYKLRLLGHMVALVLNLGATSVLFSVAKVLFSILINNEQRFQFPAHSCQPSPRP